MQFVDGKQQQDEKVRENNTSQQPSAKQNTALSILTTNVTLSHFNINHFFPAFSLPQTSPISSPEAAETNEEDTGKFYKLL